MNRNKKFLRNLINYKKIKFKKTKKSKRYLTNYKVKLKTLKKLKETLKNSRNY